MGFLDEAGNWVDKGVASVDRGTRKMGVSARIADLKRQREGLCAQLGAEVFGNTQSDSAFRASYEGLYAQIDQIDAQRATLQQELDAIEEEKSAPVCPKCGRRLEFGVKFCAGCGASMADICQEIDCCPRCGYKLSEEDLFCPNCGNHIDRASVDPIDVPASCVSPATSTESAAADSEKYRADEAQENPESEKRG